MIHIILSSLYVSLLAASMFLFFYLMIMLPLFMVTLVALSPDKRTTCCPMNQSTTNDALMISAKEVVLHMLSIVGIVMLVPVFLFQTMANTLEALAATTRFTAQPYTPSEPVENTATLTEMMAKETDTNLMYYIDEHGKVKSYSRKLLED